MIYTILVTLLAAALHIIPAPQQVTPGEGSFQIKSQTTVSCADAPEIADMLACKLSEATGYQIRSARSGGRIKLTLNSKLALGCEGYRLVVTPKGVSMVASEKAGLFYAMQTFLQLLPPEVESTSGAKRAEWTAPCVEITDAPRFRWRGLMLDACRHFISVEDVKRYIDVMASYKLNVLHWHLTDDQGWRIEIKKYPRLTEVGAWRKDFDGAVDGGYYSQDEIRDVVKYAAERHVTIVPEIEVPGHEVAAICSYPELSCEGVQVNPSYTWGVRNVVLCPGNEKVFEFLEDVFDEVTGLFPGEWVHIGGDECMKDKWEVCPKCQARIEAEGFVTDSLHTAEERLQSYTIRRVEKMLARHGKRVIGWDEILEGGLSGEAGVMSWRGEKGGIAAARMHHYVVMTPSHEGLYFDSYQGDNKVEPIGFGRYITLEKVYGYDPVPAVLAGEGLGEYVLGVQGNVWTEYIYDTWHRDYRIFPRAFALAEIAWSAPEKKDWDSFRARVNDACMRLDERGVNYHIPLPEQPGGSCDNLVFTDSAVVAFKTTRPVKMVYTLDGSEPTASSAAYEKPIVCREDTDIRIRSVMPYGKMSSVRTVKVRKQELAPAVKEPAESGFSFRKTYGRFLSTSELAGATEWEESRISSLEEMGEQEPKTNNMQDVRFYGAVAEGYINIPEDGVWRFSSLCDEVWVDGKLLIDNGTDVKRYSRHDAEAALKAGYHSIKVVFLSNIIGGWPSARNKTTISYIHTL